jgi:hypothetical protein
VTLNVQVSRDSEAIGDAGMNLGVENARDFAALRTPTVSVRVGALCVRFLGSSLDDTTSSSLFRFFNEVSCASDGLPTVGDGLFVVGKGSFSEAMLSGFKILPLYFVNDERREDARTRYTLLLKYYRAASGRRK